MGKPDESIGLDILNAQGLADSNDDQTRAFLERSDESDLAADQPD